jgi:two-component system, OmpR family, alkaline phosphatase synthesis response regulator PhoP
MAARILIVEDNTDLLEILRQVLSADYEVVTSERGKEAIELARTFEPDLVLLDLLLPDMDGVEVGATIKREAAPRRNIPILVLTARADIAREEGIIGSGCCDAFMAKPAPLPAIRAKVDELLERELHFSAP